MKIESLNDCAAAAVIALDAERNREARELASKCTWDEIVSELEKTGRNFREARQYASYLIHPVTDHRQ